MTENERELIQKRISFESKWLQDVLKEDGKVSHMDIEIAFGSISCVIERMKEEDKDDRK